METDKRYFIAGLFIIGLSVAAALFAVWLTGTGHRDDVVYRIRFAESVGGLALGDPVKFHGVDVGTVKSLRRRLCRAQRGQPGCAKPRCRDARRSDTGNSLRKKQPGQLP